MSTFYLQGCNNSNQEIEYFDSIYLPVQEIIDLDTEIQENISALLISEEELALLDDSMSIEDEEINTKDIEIQMFELKEYVNKCKQNLENITVIENEYNLKQSYDHLLTAYLLEINTNWPKLISLLNTDNISEEEMELFNTLLQKTHFNLDKNLSKFYDIAEYYASRHNIEIEKE